MASVYAQSQKLLERYAEQHDTALVSYSGGKDSLAVLDMASKVFKTVKCFFMYFVAGLDYNRDRLDFARNRYGVEIREYPHWTGIRNLKNSIYRFPDPVMEKLPEITVHHIEQLAMRDAGCQIVLHGGKKADSLWRRRTMASLEKSGHSERVYPLKEYNKFHVLAYLEKQKIPLPSSDSSTISGVGLNVSSVLWLHDVWPQDYERVRRIYPFIEAVIQRREMHGIGDWTGEGSKDHK